jgi:hypothetical protein
MGGILLQVSKGSTNGLPADGMLAAQSDFSSGPLASFHEKFDQRIWR